MSLLVQDIIKMAERQLTEAGIEDHKAEAEMLFCWLKRIDRSKFFLEWGEPADDRTCELYFNLVAERCRRIPMQHLTGVQEFMGMTFMVDPQVLVPRMDTETVVETAENLFKEKKGDSILDLCCGSGVIGISLARKIPKVKVTAVDISPAAVELTRKNAGALAVKIDVKQGNLYEPVRKKKYNMIVANPPYIRSSVIPTLMPEVKDHEPTEALDGGVDGLDFYRPIIAEANEHLKKEGLLVLEIGNDQSAQVEQLIMDTEKFCSVQTGKDLAGNDRVVTAQLIGKGK